MVNATKDLKVVVIGGGTGSSAVLRGLKKYTSEVSAVVTMFDSGGSSGLLQSEFGYPPMGDLRQCLLGLSEDNETTRALRELLGFRFQQESSLNGHSLGNLLLAALTTIGHDLEQAIEEMSRLLRIHGQVIPVSLEWADLCAELKDGETLRGESSIDLRGQSSPHIDRVFLDPQVKANPQAVKAIRQADLVILGPGDLYTSVIPNLLAEGIREALAETKATRVYVCNLMTKLGETDDFKSSDFVREMNRYLAANSLDWALINAREVPKGYRMCT
ncbi:MAG: uridine diphosphate-N-acetylglucosamine-binding protein YvcK [Dehalococcoidia bacterium]